MPAFSGATPRIADQPATQHRRELQPRVGRIGSDQRLEGVEVGIVDVEEEEARRVRRNRAE